jgi:hypothetical protein
MSTFVREAMEACSGRHRGRRWVEQWRHARRRLNAQERWEGVGSVEFLEVTGSRYIENILFLMTAPLLAPNTYKMELSVLFHQIL